MFRSGFKYLTLLLILLAMVGCSTVDQSQFNALHSMVLANQRRLRALEQQVTASQGPQAGLLSDFTTLRQEMARLNGQVEENTHRLAQMPDAEALQKSVSEGQAGMEARLSRVEGMLGVKGGGAKAPPDTPDSATKAVDVYDLGLRLFKQKSYEAARGRFQEYLKRYPTGRRADNSHYWIGETYYAQRRYEEAILSYNQVIKRFPKSGKVPSALYKQGLAFIALGDKRSAKILLGKLVKNYPKSDLATYAKKRLAKLK